MKQTFFFYDLETSGINPRTSRIMQFAGQRTDMELNPVGEPYDILIQLTEDILPQPDAIMVTGITPQKTLAEGVTEAEFVKLFLDEISQPGTIFVGFNSVRFDDEFMRFLLYRNFCDAYEWQWKDSCSRWDMLDVVRMTRALRPDGISWPFASDGKPTNRLELLTELNGLDHSNAHDALSDVRATIAVASLIKEKQPKLFDYLLKIRDKKEAAKLVQTKKSFVYTSGKYDQMFEKTTVVVSLGDHPDGKGGALVYDLRHDPAPFLKMSPEQLAEAWKWSKDPQAVKLPVKTLRFNRCPAIAPLGVLNNENKERLSIDLQVCVNRVPLVHNNDFVTKLSAAVKIMDSARADQSTMFANEHEVDSQLYEGFVGDQDKNLCRTVRNSTPDELTELVSKFKDQRMKQLMPLYKARNFRSSLTDGEREIWEEFRTTRLKQQLPDYIKRLQALAAQSNVSSEKQYLLEELQLYAESVMPEDL